MSVASVISMSRMQDTIHFFMENVCGTRVNLRGTQTNPHGTQVDLHAV